MSQFEKFRSQRQTLAKVARRANSRLSVATDLQLAQQIRMGVPLGAMLIRHEVEKLRREKLASRDLTRITEDPLQPQHEKFYEPPVDMSPEAWLAGEEPPVPDVLQLTIAANDDDEQLWEEAKPTHFVKGVNPDEVVDYYENRELDRYHEHRDRAGLKRADNPWLNEQRQQAEAKTAHAILKGFVAGFEHGEIQYLVPGPFKRLAATLDEQGCDDLIGLLANRSRRQSDTVKMVLPLLVKYGPPETVLSSEFMQRSLQRLIYARTGRCDETSKATLSILPDLAGHAWERTARTRSAIAAPVTPGDFMGYLLQLVPSRDNKIRILARDKFGELADRFGAEFPATDALVVKSPSWTRLVEPATPRLPAARRPLAQLALGSKS